MSASVKVGDVAPPLCLPGTDGTVAGRRDHSLAEHRGRPVVLVFYPADNTPVCTVQLQTYTADIGAFEAAGAQVLAISPQSVDEHEAFSAAEGPFAFPLLADEEQEAATAYDTLGPIGFYRRCVFVIDGEGIVRYVHRSTAGLTFRPVEELAEVVRSL